MKGDFSRRTFDPSKHYRSVQMQQGRVQLDADWNEQSDIAAHRVETEAQDVIGEHGAPLHEAGFHIVTEISGLTAEESAEPGNRPKPMPELARRGDFFISAGRYYVEGILCENESLTTYRGQPDLPGPPDAPTAGNYLVYLDVWPRHLTALDDPSLRETALGGPDTATRAKTVWQVKCLAANVGDCAAAAGVLKGHFPTSHGTLRARVAAPSSNLDPCTLAPSGGYRGLENQLYRVEVHAGGAAYRVPGDGSDGFAVSGLDGATLTVSGGSWNSGDLVEVFRTAAVGGATAVDPMAGELACVISVADADAGTGQYKLTLSHALRDLTMQHNPKVRPVGPMQATFKWSRDNGTVVTEITKIAPPGTSGDTEITVHDLGPDEVLGFAEGQWVEVADDAHELGASPGHLARIVRVNRKPVDPIVTVRGKVDALAPGDTGVDGKRHPKLRRWDGVGLVKYLEPSYPDSASKDWQHLEDGIQVQFSTNGYVTGDYWLIPARAITASAESGHIEWPGLEDNDPHALEPAGIKHHYALLAILLGKDQGAPEVLSDCRILFPPLTEPTLVYVSGDGQEAMPGDPLPKPLQVGVFRGPVPVTNARVQFTAPSGNGYVADKSETPWQSTRTSVDVTTGDDGIASCYWLMDATRNDPATWQTPQRVEARLLDAAGVPVGPPVHFNANLSIAEQVAYHPEANTNLSADNTAQSAVDKLARLTRLYAVAGDGQEAALPHLVLPHLVEVAVANDLGPVVGAQVRFDAGIGFVAPEGGDVVASNVHATEPPLATDSNGIAKCQWRLAPGGEATQQLVATLVAAGDRPFQTPQQSVVFTGNRTEAGNVSYNPGPCRTLAGKTNVQEALDTLGRAGRLCYLSGSGQEAALQEVEVDGARVPAYVLPRPLQVAVLSDCGPIYKARVVFVTTSGKLSSSLEDLAGSGGVTTLPTETKEELGGVAQCYWKLDSEKREQSTVQQVAASLIGQDGRPILPPVRFSGHYVTAANVTYSPPEQCRILRDAATVQAAIDRLCQQIAGPGTRPRLDFGATIAKQRLTNGQRVRATAMNGGIALTVQRAHLPVELVNDMTCYVTLELPYPGVQVAVGPAGPILTPSPCFGPFIPWATVDKSLNPDQSTTVTWTPNRKLEEWTSGWFKAAATSPLGGVVRAHFVLKGETLVLPGEPEDWPLRHDIDIWFLIEPQ